MKFGNILKDLRKKKNLSQEELADKLGISRQSVSKWECGESYPEMSNLLALCEIFHCKLNDLVHENVTDLNNLDEEIQNKVAKLKKEQQIHMKLLSKIIYVIAKIGKIASIVGLVTVLLTIILTPVFITNIKVEEQKISFFGETVAWKEIENGISLSIQNHEIIQNNTQDIIQLKKMIEILKNNSKVSILIIIEIAFACLSVTLYLLYLLLKHLEHLFQNIHNGETPFTIENVSHIKKMAWCMIGTILIPDVIGGTLQCFIEQDLGIGWELFDFIYILFLFSLTYIFEYGYLIQKDSKGIMYDEIEKS